MNTIRKDTFRNRFTLVLLLLVPTVFVFISSVSEAQQPFVKTAEVEGITEYRLANGCRVLLYPDNSSNSVTINMTVFVGSRHEGYGETGMAHLLEHMLFKGTPKHGDIDKELKAKGVLDMNGTTWYDRTNYYETLPASDENMDWAISMEADRLVNCFIRGEDLLAEMTVVRSEFEQSENSSSQILNQRLMANAFEWHNYGKSVIGNKADIERVPIPSLRAFYEKYYRPDNIQVVVAGKFDPAKAVESAVKHFGALKNPKADLPKTYTSEPVQDGERIVYLNRTGDVPMVGVGYHVPAVAHPDNAAVQVLDWILGDEPSGRMYKGLVKTKLATSVFSRVEAGYDPGMLTCFATLEASQDVEKFRKTMTANIESVLKSGVTDAEVARAIASISKEKEDAIVDAGEFAMTLSDWAAYGDWRLFFIVRDRIEKVTVADVNRVAKAYLKPSNRTTGIFLPTENPDRATIPQTPNVANLVKDYKGKETVVMGEAFDATPENIAARIQQGEFKSGVKFVMLPKKTRGDRFFLFLTLRFGSESAFNSREKIVAAQYLGDLMTTGTSNYTRQELEDKQTALKTRIGVMSDVGELSVSIEGRKEHLNETLDLLHEILRKPTFPEEEFNLLKSESVNGIMQQRSDPMMQAQVRLGRELTPVAKDHIDYAPTIKEMISENRSAKLDHVKQLYTEMINGSAGELTLVGSFDDPAGTAKRIEAMLSNWNSNQTYTPIHSKPYDVPKKSIVLETPDKANALVVLGANFDAKSDDPDWEALMIAADIIGGGSMASRLGQKVREEKGLSYSVGCQFAAGDTDRAGSFVTFAITNPANRAALVETIKEVYDDVLKDGVTEKELTDAKTTYQEQIEEMLNDEQSLAGTLHSYQHRELDMAFLRERLSRVQSLTKADVDKAAWRLLNANAVTVAAGDFANAKKEDKVQTIPDKKTP